MVELTKEESKKKISLRKDKVVSLIKKKNIANIKARVGLVLDFSGSMSSLYEDGTVQNIIERIIPIALNFDDNGELDFWIFENGFVRLDSITMDNFYGLAKDLMKKYDMGGTRYEPVIKDVDSFYIEENPMNIPNYVIFITDGDNSDKHKAEEIITSVSRHPIFFQFIGIGNSSFSFLEKLDEMDGRYVDNANFFSVTDINNMSDDDLYDKLLSEFPVWLKYQEVKTMLENVKDLPKLDTFNKNTKKKGFFSRLFG